MNARVLRGAWGGVSVLVLGMLASPSLCGDPAGGTGGGRSAQDLVQAALQAEVSGKTDERGLLLRQAASRDPNYAPARWHSGYVSMGGQWRSIEEVQRRAAADPRLAEYRRLRDAQAGTPPGELTLARWCKQNGLDDQARFHWKRVLLVQPQNLEAQKALGVQWYRGRLLTPEEIKQAQADRAQPAKDRARYRTEAKRWQKHWDSQVAQWREAAKRSDSGLASSIRAELAAIDFSTPTLASAAINNLHALVLERSRSDKDQNALRQVGLALVKALDAITEPAATHSMILYSVDHPIAEVRAVAADALKKRPKGTYVPWLLARMVSPIESSYAIVVLPGGGVIYEHSFFREGAEADYRDVRSQSSFFKASVPAPDTPPPNGWRTTESSRQRDATNRSNWFADNTTQVAIASAKAQTEARAKAIMTERSVERANRATLELNDRIQFVLTRATGADLDANPKAWSDWWYGYGTDEYELDEPDDYPGGKPVYETYWYSTSYATASPPPSASYDPPPPAPLPPGSPVRRFSCFARGTKVWTLTGPVAIENVKVGDHVLAQHPRSAELAFKPVLAVTARKPSERMKVALGSESILTTRGHPFWACGEGWKMAKDLKVGQRLHTVSGAVTIDALEELAPAKPWETSDTFSYNLVVDDFHNYFVGDRKVLVHDNLLYVFDGPTGPLPGLARR
jgi:hypothetical protein